MNSPRHIPVMLNEVLDTLKPEAGKYILTQHSETADTARLF